MYEGTINCFLKYFMTSFVFNYANVHNKNTIHNSNNSNALFKTLLYTEAGLEQFSESGSCDDHFAKPLESGGFLPSHFARQCYCNHLLVLLFLVTCYILVRTVMLIYICTYIHLPSNLRSRT
jgi:hypothetical protein